jgi:hypothetical protein
MLGRQLGTLLGFNKQALFRSNPRTALIFEKWEKYRIGRAQGKKEIKVWRGCGSLAHYR